MVEYANIVSIFGILATHNPTIIFFFFQAEDGIRDLTVTGVQTCALPISFIQAALQDAADLEPIEDQLRITLAPLSSPHRSRVLETLCQALNQTHTRFPGTQLEIHYAIAACPARPKSGQVSEVPCQEF